MKSKFYSVFQYPETQKSITFPEDLFLAIMLYPFPHSATSYPSKSIPDRSCILSVPCCPQPLDTQLCCPRHTIAIMVFISRILPLYPSSLEKALENCTLTIFGTVTLIYLTFRSRRAYEYNSSKYDVKWNFLQLTYNVEQTIPTTSKRLQFITQ